MAEHVQLRLEETLQELEQMESIGLFDSGEIRKITKRRRDLQYKLQRRTKTKEDFLNCIEYELNLLKLIERRREKRRLTAKKHDIDYSIATRINNLYKAVVYRHQNDTKLWQAFIQFLERMKWKEAISKIYSRILQVHADKPSIWIAAANWEMMDNNAAESARSIMLRGLRFHPKSKELYLEYFRLELVYADRIRKRRSILGISDVEIEQDKIDAVIEGKIALVIYKNAIENVTDVDFHLGFLSVCKQFDFTTEMQAEIFQDLQDHHSIDESMWNYLAKTHLFETKQQLDKVVREKDLSEDEVVVKSYNDCFEVFRTAVEVIPTEKMWTFFIQTCLEGCKETNQQTIPLPVSVKRQCMEEAMRAMKEADSLNFLADFLYVEWVSLLKKAANQAGVAKVLIAATTNYRCSAKFWKLRLENEIKEGIPKMQVQATFNEAINAINDEDSLPIWLLAIEWSRIILNSKPEDLFEKALKSSPNVVKAIKPLYLESIALEHGITEARKLYIRLCYQFPICEEFFYKMLKIEEAQLVPNMDKIRNIFEDLVSHFGKSNIKPWINYIMAEKTKGQPMNISKIHWRAVNTLEPELEAKFVTALTIMNAKSS